MSCFRKVLVTIMAIISASLLVFIILLTPETKTAKGELISKNHPNKNVIIKMTEWSNTSPLITKNLRKFDSTPSWVIIGHTVTKMCNTTSTCSTSLNNIRNYHLLLQDEIKYNFLIGGDGNIYEARGWDYSPAGHSRAVFISFMGNFMVDELNSGMIDAAKKLLTIGVTNEKLAEDYALVCHNQTIATLSPGINVYKVVKNWPHFTTGGVINDQNIK